MCQHQQIVRDVVIRNKLGLHLRPVRLMVEEANRFASDVTIVMGDRQVDGKSFLDLMSLAAAMDSTLTLKAMGPDATQAVNALEALVQRKFDEE